MICNILCVSPPGISGFQRTIPEFSHRFHGGKNEGTVKNPKKAFFFAIQSHCLLDKRKEKHYNFMLSSCKNG